MVPRVCGMGYTIICVSVVWGDAKWAFGQIQLDSGYIVQDSNISWTINRVYNVFLSKQCIT